MPSKSKAQKNLMAACAHGANYEKCPPMAVAKKFNKADEAAHMKMLREQGLHKDKK